MDTGEICEIEIFSVLLPASHYTYLKVIVSQKKEDFIKSMNNWLSYFGGVHRSNVG